MKSRYRSSGFAALAIASVWAFPQVASAATVSISGQVFSGNAPIAGTPAPASFAGNFIQAASGDIPATVASQDWLLPGGPPRVQLSPYAFNTDGNTGAPYSVLDSGGGPVSSATYNVNGGSFTLLWGSPDPYNSVSFFSGPNGNGSPEGSFTGPSLPCFGSGACADFGFDVVTFAATAGSIGSVILSDTGTAAFEFGIIPVSAVPLPSAIYLFGSVLGGAFWMSRRKRSAFPSSLAEA